MMSKVPYIIYLIGVLILVTPARWLIKSFSAVSTLIAARFYNHTSLAFFSIVDLLNILEIT